MSTMITKKLFRVYVGIDIGKHGAISIMFPCPIPGEEPLISTFKMPMTGKEVNYKAVHKILDAVQGKDDITSNLLDVVVVFEKLQPIFGSSKTTAFSMGHQAGAIEMACIALDLEYHKVSPKVWQKDIFGGNVVPGDTKASALLAARRLYPKEDLVFPRGKVPHDGLVDALLLAEYGRRNF